MRPAELDPRRVTRAVRDGKTILRAMANEALVPWAEELKGTVLDLASGDGSTALQRVAPAARWVRVDVGHRPDVRADLTASLPFGDDAADGAALVWFLYIAPDPAAVLAEIRRVLRPGGVLLLATPLAFGLNPEPRDLWRFTGEGLERLLDEAGFQGLDIVSLGGRWTSAAFLLDPYQRPRRWVAPAVARAALALDAFSDRRWGDRVAPAPTGFVAKAIA
jgi:SAM-dependent methyltransferase